MIHEILSYNETYRTGVYDWVCGCHDSGNYLFLASGGYLCVWLDILVGTLLPSGVRHYFTITNHLLKQKSTTTQAILV